MNAKVKKLLSLLLCGTMSISIFGCGGVDSSSTENNKQSSSSSLSILNSSNSNNSSENSSKSSTNDEYSSSDDRVDSSSSSDNIFDEENPPIHQEDASAKTINVSLWKTGYGDTFIYELKDYFEKNYAEEGYKMNILAPSYQNAGTPILQEMARGYEATNIDLYITGSITPNQVSKNGEFGELCADLKESVFNQTAINYDGSKSSNKISEKILPAATPYLSADDGTMYGFNWANSTAGMAVNLRNLAMYGVTELPRTTNELFEIFDMIISGANGMEGSNIYPITYSLNPAFNGKPNYQDFAISTWMAQYDVDAYNEFCRMQTQNDNGAWTDMSEGYRVFENENIKEVLEVGYQLMDTRYAPKGAGSFMLDQAQNLILHNTTSARRAVFMLNGDWLLNESKVNYNTLDEITLMNVPVISALGIKLFGESTKYNLPAIQCDELLSYICKLVDENKTIEEIQTSVKAQKNIALDKADAEAVASARGVCYSCAPEHLAFITKDSPKKDIAALVLRMMASDDFAETFMKRANATTPYTTNIQLKSNYAFVNAAKNLSTNIYYRTITNRFEGLRYNVLQSNYLFPETANLALELYRKLPAVSYREAANAFYLDSLEKAKTAWNTYYGI